MRECEFRDLGWMGYAEAYSLQQKLVSLRKQDRIPDQFLIVEHPHVITMGRNARPENLLATQEQLARAGVELHVTDRGGDFTYHGPGQVVGYPILDLNRWKRDVAAYVHAIEQVIIDALGRFGIAAEREAGARGVWVNGAKVAAIGIHISQWVTSHGFALNLDTDLNYFHYIIPCGLTKPVTRMRDLGFHGTRAEVSAALADSFQNVFQCAMVHAAGDAGAMAGLCGCAAALS